MGNINSQKGFTLVEMVVALAIFSVLIFETASLFIIVFSGSKQQYLSLDNVDNARLVASRFVNEIRSAVPGVDGSATIAEAGEDAIVFYSPDRSNPALVDKIRYFIEDGILKKGVTVPEGEPLDYISESETISSVQPDLSLGEESLFYYYDGDYDGINSPLEQPVNINDIRFVRINLVVLKQTTQGSESTFAFSVGSAVRSLKDNLGE